MDFQFIMCLQDVLVQSQGPYRIILDRLYNCELGEHGFDGTVRFYIRLSHYNPVKRAEPQVFRGNFTVGVTITDEHWVSCIKLV